VSIIYKCESCGIMAPLVHITVDGEDHRICALCDYNVAVRKIRNRRQMARAVEDYHQRAIEGREAAIADGETK